MSDPVFAPPVNDRVTHQVFLRIRGSMAIKQGEDLKVFGSPVWRERDSKFLADRLDHASNSTGSYRDNIHLVDLVGATRFSHDFENYYYGIVLDIIIRVYTHRSFIAAHGTDHIERFARERINERILAKAGIVANVIRFHGTEEVLSED